MYSIQTIITYIIQTKAQILGQALTSMLAQTNACKQIALALLHE